MKENWYYYLIIFVLVSFSIVMSLNYRDAKNEIQALQKTKPLVEAELKPVVDKVKTPQALYPNSDTSVKNIKERMLYGEYSQQMGESMMGLNFLSTDEFGPYTVIQIKGKPGAEVIRMGFYELTDEGELILHLRFIEKTNNEMTLEPITEKWKVSVEHPFIHLSQGVFDLITSGHTDEEIPNIEDAYREENKKLDNIGKKE